MANIQEPRARIQQVKKFEWDEVPTNAAELPFFVLVEGMQGSGKTHFSLSFPEPIFILDTENRADKVIAKFSKVKTVFRKKIESFDDIRQAILQGIFPEFKGGTIVIDSGSDLQNLREIEYLEETGQKKVYPKVNFAQVREPIIKLLSAIRDRGFYCVITGRLKDEYKDDVKTGEMVLEGFSRLPYFVDIHLRLNGDGTATVIKNGFRTTSVEKVVTLDNPNFNSIMEKLVKPAEEVKFIIEKVEGEKNKAKNSPVERLKNDWKGKISSDENKTPQKALNAFERQGAEKPQLEETKHEDDYDLEPLPDDDLPASREFIQRAYNHGRECGLNQSSIQLCLSKIKPDGRSAGLTNRQVRMWIVEIDRYVEEFMKLDTAANEE